MITHLKPLTLLLRVLHIEEWKKSKRERERERERDTQKETGRKALVRTQNINLILMEKKLFQHL